MPDTVLQTPAETPRSVTPSTQPSENFALSAGSAIAGWAITGLTKKVLAVAENGDARPGSAPPTQSRFNKVDTSKDTPTAFKGLGTTGDVDAWKDEEFDDEPTTTHKSSQWRAPVSSAGKRAMKLGGSAAGKKASVVDKVIEEEKRKSVDEGVGAAASWGDDWDVDDKEDAWGFDD